MGSLRVEGGHRLSGSVVVSGAKNSALKLMAASLLAQGRTVLANVPRIADVFTMIDVLRHVGASVDFLGDVMAIDSLCVCVARMIEEAAWRGRNDVSTSKEVHISSQGGRKLRDIRFFHFSAKIPFQNNCTPPSSLSGARSPSWIR